MSCCVFRSNRASCCRPSRCLSLNPSLNPSPSLCPNLRLSLNPRLSFNPPVSSALSKMCLHHQPALVRLLSFHQCCSRRQCSSKLLLQVRQDSPLKMQNTRALCTLQSIYLCNDSCPLLLASSDLQVFSGAQGPAGAMVNQTVTPASLTQPAQVGSTKSQTDTGCLGQIMILVSKNSDLNNIS